MKKLIKWKWFPMVAVIAAIVVAVLVMTLLGFRITYAPELENSWEAISAVAAWAGVITSIAAVGASFAAVWFAIRVPKEIAEQQNKIAQFEKRMECYLTIREIFMFCDSLRGRKLTNNDVMQIYKLNLGDREGILNITDSNNIFLDLTDVRAFQTYSICVNSGRFLFENYDYQLAVRALIKANDIATYITEHEIEKQGSISKELENLIDNLQKDYENLKKLLHTMQDQINLLN